MALSRRAALQLACAFGLLPYGGARAGTSAGEAYVAAYMDMSGSYGSAVLEPDGTVRARLTLPDRGHGAAMHPALPHGVQFARRPGRFAIVFDWRDGSEVSTIHAAENRHFYGHGVFSPDGRLLYATENDVPGERGVIGIYDAGVGYARIGELPSHGIGPHEMILLPDGQTLAVANGGILTDPELPRLKLNLADMDPNVSLIDRADGTLLHQVRPPAELHRLSLRHLSANADGTIALAAQWEGAEADLPPLVGLSTRGGPLRLMEAPGAIQPALRNYCGSVAFNRAGNLFAVSAPRGNTITFWRADGTFENALALTDGCGLASYRDGFLLTSGQGAIQVTDSARPAARAAVAWDNHLTRI